MSWCLDYPRTVTRTLILERHASVDFDDWCVIFEWTYPLILVFTETQSSGLLTLSQGLNCYLFRAQEERSACVSNLCRTVCNVCCNTGNPPLDGTPSPLSSHLPFRHLREADNAGLQGERDVQVQDGRVPRPAQPHLQGDVRIPGGALPAVRGVAGADGVLPPEQHEAQGEVGLGLPGPQQLQRGAAGPLGRDEGGWGSAGLPLAHTHRHIGGSSTRTELAIRVWCVCVCAAYRCEDRQGSPVFTARDCMITL